MRGSRCDLLVRSRRTQPGPLAGYPPPGGLAAPAARVIPGLLGGLRPSGGGSPGFDPAQRSDGEPSVSGRISGKGRRRDPMGCSPGSIENAHLIVVPSCGHWSRAGPPPGGPCLERQSYGCPTRSRFRRNSFRREQASSLQHRLICGVDVIHKPVRSDDLRVSPQMPSSRRGKKPRGCPLRSVRAPARIDRLDDCQPPDWTTPSRSEPPLAGDSDPLGDQAAPP